MTYAPFNHLDYLDTVEVCQAYIRVQEDEFRKLTKRYDDAMERIYNMEQEMLALKQEAGRE